MPVSIPALVAAVALTAAFAALFFVRRQLAAPSLSLWVGGIALVWGLANTLWLPWLDAALVVLEVDPQHHARCWLHHPDAPATAPELYRGGRA
jgi:hypothetical protein